VRIEHIICNCFNLKSLDGCPSGLKSLFVFCRYLHLQLEPLMGCTELESLNIYNARKLSDLTPFNACTRLKKLTIRFTQVTDISVLSSMPLLVEVDLSKHDYQASIKDLSPLIHCKRLRELHTGYNRDIEDLSPLAQCTQLDALDGWPN
jgi:Leucine-rich repeat (LRR) protein